MSKAEEILAKLNARKVETLEESDVAKNRKRYATDWVAHYIAVKKLRTQFLADGGLEEEFTASKAEELLVESWEDKASKKEEEAI